MLMYYIQYYFIKFYTLNYALITNQILYTFYKVIFLNIILHVTV